ncbi:MAG: hypothetical protein STSR0006_07080 [Lentimicrobium sp.]
MSIKKNSEVIRNKAGEMKRMYACIFVFAIEKNISGIKAQIETANRFLSRRFLNDFHRNQINGT